ncbi:hypothetical protein QN386_25580, partial [Pseudomonas sp. CCI3.2]|nr:hypothetical protein [Pseudomonas sp. CCI3.2]MEB0170436.1 hypothetical protein [Pseudomonas sp. CCC4.4]
PENAFYYLVSLFANIRITVEANPEYCLPACIESFNPVPMDIRASDTRIRYAHPNREQPARPIDRTGRPQHQSLVCAAESSPIPRSLRWAASRR